DVCSSDLATCAEVLTFAKHGDHVDLEELLRELARRDVVTALIEGGGVLLGGFFDRGLVDKVYAVIAPIIVGAAGAPGAVAGRGAARLADALRMRDIAAHLLADDLGRLSRGRDAYARASFVASTPENVESQLLEFINRQNETWVAAARRLSPILLMELLRWSGDETQKYFESLDMFALGEPVSWAGPESASAWLDIARESSERWLHQAQVRDAVSAPLLTQPRLFLRALDTFV